MQKHRLRIAPLRLLALLLFLSLFLSFAAIAAPVEPTYPFGGRTYALQLGTVCFTPLRTRQSVVPFYYSDGFFSVAPEEYSPQIAALSAAMSASSAHATSQYAEETLAHLGFQGIDANSAFKNGTDDADSVGFLFAHKPLRYADGSETGRELLLVLIRGAEYDREWSNNFLLGVNGDAEGFSASAKTVSDALRDYIRTYACLSDAEKQGNLKYYVCGHSRGGAVANLLSKALIDRERADRPDAPNAVYGYTLAAPRCGVSAGSYLSIHNIVNPADIVTCVAPAEYGFFRYGTDYALTCSPDDTAFLKRLRQISPDEDYPAQFAVAYLTLDMGQSLTALTDRLRSASFDDLFSPYPDEEQISLSEYLSDFTNHFLGVWNSGRASGYATRTFNGGSVSLETAIRDWLQIYCGMSGADIEHLGVCLSALPEQIERFDLLAYLNAILFILHLPKWQDCSVKERANDIRFLWSVLSACEKDGYRLETIFGENYSLIQEDFPVLADFLFEMLSLDYQQRYSTEKPIRTTARPMYIFSTVIYNLVTYDGSMLYPHSLGAYMAALQNEDSLYRSPILMLNDTPVGPIDDAFYWILAEYDTQGKLLSVTDILAENFVYTFPPESDIRLFCVDGNGLPCGKPLILSETSVLSTLRLI